MNRVEGVQNNHNGHRLVRLASTALAGKGGGGDILGFLDDPQGVGQLHGLASDTKRATVHEWWQ